MNRERRHAGSAEARWSFANHLEVAANNRTGATKGVSDSLMTQRQWGFALRTGNAWVVRPKMTLGAGYGLYYDRGELFSYFSPPAGSGFNAHSVSRWPRPSSSPFPRRKMQTSRRLSGPHRRRCRK